MRKSSNVVGINSISGMIARATGVPRYIIKLVLKSFIEIVGESVRSGCIIIMKELFTIRRAQRPSRRLFVVSTRLYKQLPERSYIAMRSHIRLIKELTNDRSKDVLRDK